MSIQRRIQNPITLLRLSFLQLLTIFAKNSVLDAWQDSEYSSGGKFIPRLNFEIILELYTTIRLICHKKRCSFERLTIATLNSEIISKASFNNFFLATLRKWCVASFSRTQIEKSIEKSFNLIFALLF